jgi:hypothetical protein
LCVHPRRARRPPSSWASASTLPSWPRPSSSRIASRHGGPRPTFSSPGLLRPRRPSLFTCRRPCSSSTLPSSAVLVRASVLRFRASVVLGVLVSTLPSSALLCDRRTRPSNFPSASFRPRPSSPSPPLKWSMCFLLSPLILDVSGCVIFMFCRDDGS